MGGSHPRGAHRACPALWDQVLQNDNRLIKIKIKAKLLLSMLKCCGEVTAAGNDCSTIKAIACSYRHQLKLWLVHICPDSAWSWGWTPAPLSPPEVRHGGEGTAGKQTLSSSLHVLHLAGFLPLAGSQELPACEPSIGSALTKLPFGDCLGNFGASQRGRSWGICARRQHLGLDFFESYLKAS